MSKQANKPTITKTKARTLLKVAEADRIYLRNWYNTISKEYKIAASRHRPRPITLAGLDETRTQLSKMTNEIKLYRRVLAR
jgi:hypothetical protein